MNALEAGLPDALPRVVRVHARGVIRSRPEDFQVVEEAGFQPEGEGQHALLLVEKRGANTEFVARQLARFAGVPVREVGYAGLKDRHALTQQWFSIDLQGRVEPDWDAFGEQDVRVISATRHRRKIRRGALRGNHFRIAVRELLGERDAVERRLCAIRAAGVPNYFGEQRFGRDGANLVHARAMLAAGARSGRRHQRGLYLSAARALLFNLVVAARVREGLWDRALPGDVMMLDVRRGFFTIDAVDDETANRVERLEIHPTAPLWGRGGLRSGAQAQALETAALAGYEEWCAGLERFGLDQDRRPTRLHVRDLEWDFDGEQTLWLRFFLPRGGYATAVLRELIESQ